MHTAKETCGKIKESFLQLSKEQPAQKIKVKDIMEHAGLAKSTFYLNYENTAGLISEIMDDTVKFLMEPFSTKTSESSPCFTQSACSQFIQNVLEQKEKILFLTHQTTSVSFADQLQRALQRIMVNRLRQERCGNSDFLHSFGEILSQGLVCTLFHYLESDLPEPMLRSVGCTTEQIICSLAASLHQKVPTT